MFGKAQDLLSPYLKYYAVERKKSCENGERI